MVAFIVNINYINWKMIIKRNSMMELMHRFA